MALTATPFGYGEISLEWDFPTGTWDRLRLVRSQYGTPANEDDGTVLVDANCGPSAASGYYYPLSPSQNQVAVVVPEVTSYIDTSLSPSTIYYYALFVRQVSALPTVPWTYEGYAEAYSVGNLGGQDILLNALPGVYTSPGEMAGQPDPNSDLGNYLALLGYDLDLDNEFLNGLALIRSPAEMDGSLLIPTAPMFGYTYEHAIGMRQNREILANAAFLNQVKGTWTGILGLASSATTYGALMNPLVNLFPDDNDTIGQGTTTRWGPQSATLAEEVPPVSPYYGDPSVANGNFVGSFGGCDSSGQVSNFSINGSGLATIGYDTTEANGGSGSMKLTWANGSPGPFNLGSGASCTATGLTIGQTYTASGWVWNSAGNNKVFILIPGVAIGSSTTSHGQWQEVSVTFVATATSHSIEFNMISSTAGWTTWVDTVQLNSGSTVTSFTTTLPGRCFALDATSTSNVYMTYALGLGAVLNAIPVSVGTAYTFSGYTSLQNAGSTVSFTPLIIWWDQNGNLLSPNTVGSSFSTPGTVTSWGQFSVSGSPPFGAVYASMALQFTTIANGQTVYVTCLQFEPHSTASTFQRARSLNITMVADRINEVLNAGFDLDATQWGTNDATISQQSTVVYNRGAGAALCVPSTASEPPVYPGATTFPGSSTYPGGGQPAVFTQVNVDYGAPFTFACQLNPVSAATFQLSIKWANSGGNIIETDTGAVFACGANVWTRVYFTTTVPLAAVTGTLVITQTTASAVNWYLDDVLGEETSILQNYFDTSVKGSNVLFEGATSESRMHLYEHWKSRSSRLLTLLPLQVPMGSTFQVLYAQPALPRGTYGYGIYGDGIYGL